MTILKPEMFFLVLVFGLVLIFVYRFKERKLEKILSFYPFKKRFFFSLNSYLFLIGFFFLMVSLLDFRGEGEKIAMEGKSVDLMILLDQSTSMLCEDVSPSRKEKSLFFAKYLIRNLNSVKTSLGVFAENYQEISPFTLDKDYLESKLDQLKDSFMGGSSEIRLSLQEAVQKVISRKKRNILILMITDAEEQDITFSLDLPANLQLGLVVVGTEEGGPIPFKDASKNITGYKMHNGEKVITKRGSKIVSYLKERISGVKVWILDQKSFPADQIISFIQYSAKNEFNQEVIYKKNYHTYFSLLGLFFIVLSLLSRRGLILYFFLISIAHAEEIQIDLIEKRKKADEFLKQEKYLQSKILYEDLLKTFPNDLKIKFNLATSYLGLHDFSEALKIFSELKDLDDYKRANVLFALKKKSCNNPKKEDNKEDNKDQKQNNNQENKNDQSQNNDNNKDEKNNENNKRKNDQSQQQVNQDQKDYKTQALEEFLQKIKEQDSSLQKDKDTKKKGLYGRGSKKDW